MSEKIQLSFPEGFTAIEPFETIVEPSATLPEPPPSPVTNETLFASGDRGAVDFSEILDSSKLAYHGFRGVVSTILKNRAEARVERMEHKDDLYEGIGAVATGTAVSAGGVRPRSFAERFMDKRLDDKRFRSGYKEAKRLSVQQRYGGRTKTKMDGINPAGRAKKAGARRGVEAAYKSGSLTARERSAQLREIKITDIPQESWEQRRVRRQDEKARTGLKKSVEQPILSRWRNVRKERATKAVAAHKARIDKRQDKINSI